MLLNHAQRFAETLEVHDLSCPQETDGINDVRILGNTQNIVVGGTGLLFRRQIFRQIRDGIALGLEFTCVLRNPAGRLGPYGKGVVDIIGAEA